MTARQDSVEHDVFVAVPIGDRVYHVALDNGEPCSARRALPNGEPCAWWLLSTLPADGEHWQAARAAEAFVAEFRQVAS